MFVWMESWEIDTLDHKIHIWQLLLREESGCAAEIKSSIDAVNEKQRGAALCSRKKLFASSRNRYLTYFSSNLLEV